MVASTAYLDEVLRPAVMVRTLAHGSAVALLLAGLLATYLLSGRLTRPMDLMVQQLDRNAHSDTPQPLPVLADDELGRLAREFNSYLEVIARQHADLAREQERYRNLFEASPDAILMVHDEKIVDCNPATAAIFGADLDTLVGRSAADFSDRFRADDTWSLGGMAQRVVDEGTTELQTFEWTCRREDGRRFDAEVRLKLFGESGATPCLLAFIRDITRRNQAVDALRQSEEKYRQLIENASDAIVIVQDQQLVFANSRAFEMTGYSPSEMPEEALQAVIHPDDLPLVIERHRQRTTGLDGLPSTYTFRMVTRQQSTLTVQISVILVDWNGRPATLNFLRDITDQMKMEAALQQAQKMEAVGTLAGGIAHDFNNLMQAVQGHVTLIDLDLPPGHAYREHVQAIEELVDSARHLTQQLLGFARGGKYRPRPVNVNDLVADSTQLFGRTHKELVIETTTAAGPVVVVADRQQIEQVLLNMYINAGHAMPDGGTLRVSIGVLELDRMFCEPYGTTPGTYARISITDTGVGMDEATCRQVFDPFFTTKHKTRGTGLGLASAYGIVKNHSGFVTVSSEPGHGTTFQVFLPKVEDSVTRTAPSLPPLQRGHECLLLVDDEPAVTRVGRGLLERLGYDVLVADGGEAAVELLQANEGRIDLVILDMIMPGLDGRETFERLRALQPDLAVILSSGYALDGRATELMTRGCRGFIQKPFRLADLSAEVRRVLEDAPPPA